MNFQNLNFDHVESRPSIANPRRASNQTDKSDQSEDTLRAHQEHRLPVLPGPDTDNHAESPLTVIPRVPSLRSLPQRLSSLSTSSEPELYGPDRIFAPPQVGRVFTRPVVVEAPLRRVPKLLPSPPPQPTAWGPTFSANMATDEFRDQLARLEGMVTPGVDDTPYIQYAIEALTRHRDRDTGYGDNDSSSSDDGAFTFMPDQQPGPYQPYPFTQGGFTHDPTPMPMPPAQTDEAYLPQPRAARAPPEPKQPYDPRFLNDLEPPRPLQDCRTSADTLASSLKNGQRLTQPYEWRPVEREYIAATVGEQKAAGVPTLDFKPTALRAPSLLGLMAFCVLMIAALISSAVYSEIHRGLLPYVSIYGGQYFLFRILSPIIAAILLLYAQFIITTILRTLPFVRLASNDSEERDGALFQDLYPRSFLWPKLVGTWQSWVPILITCLANVTIPLQNSLFTVILVDGEWMWAAVQGVAWTLVALYLALLVSTTIVWRYWANLEITGLMWDQRSIADVAAIVSDTNVADDYYGTEMAKSRDGIRFALRRRTGDRLGYWTWKDGRHGFWYTLGNSLSNPHTLPSARDQLSGQRMVKNGENTDPDHVFRASDIDVEASAPSAHSQSRYLPWCLRTNQLSLFITAASVLLLALFLVAFLPSTRITNGFLPLLPAGPSPGAFSSANFLYSFLPSLLGTVLFLLFQPLDLHLRVLQPWATLSSTRASPASASILADYAACAPIQSSLRAIRNGHFRVAAVSFLATLYILIPVLAGATFMALTPPDGAVKMYPNIPAFAVTLALLVLYIMGLAILFPRRKELGMPHGVGCLAEMVGFLVNEDILGEQAFKACRKRGEMLERLGDKGKGESWWFFGGGKAQEGLGAWEKGSALGVRRARKFTERVRKSQIRRGVRV